MNSHFHSFASYNNQSFQNSKSFANNSPSRTQNILNDKSKITFSTKDNIIIQDSAGPDSEDQLIWDLEQVPAQARELVAVNLANNQIEDLQGIQQFQNVKQLSLANNQIGNILNVYHLRPMTQIEELDLRGNPITTRPAYRPTVLLFMKNLKMLDGKTVKASERLKIPAQLDSQYSLLDRLLRNYIEILRLQSVSQRLDLLKEFFALEKSFLITYVPFDLDKLRRLYNYQDTINEKIRNGFRADLLSDIRLIEIEFLNKQDMQAAASELLSRQSNSITEITARIKQKFQAVSNFYRDNFPRFNAYEHNPEENLVPSIVYPKSPFKKNFAPARKSPSPVKRNLQNPNVSMTVNEVFNFQNNPFDSVNQSTLSLRSPVDKRPQKKSLMASRPVHKSVVYDRLYSPQRNILSPNRKASAQDNILGKNREKTLSPGQRDLLRTYQRMSHKEGEPKQKGRAKSPQELLNYVNSTSNNGSPGRSRNFFNMSPKSATYRMAKSEEGFYRAAGGEPEEGDFVHETPTRRDLKMRENQLNQLVKNLEQKLSELNEVDRTNRELKEKLRSMMKQNEIEVQEAQEKIEKVNDDARIIAEAKRNIEVNIQETRRSIARLQESNKALKRETENLHVEREDLKKYEGALNEAQLIDERGNNAFIWYQKKLLAKAFRYLSIATDRSKKVNEVFWNKKNREDKELLTQTFGMFKRNNIIAKIVAYKNSRFNSQHLQKFFVEWKLYVRHERAERILTQKKREDMMATAFSGLKQYTEMRELKKTVKARVQSYYVESLITRGFSVLKRNYQLYGLNAKVEKKLTVQAEAKNREWIKRLTFLKWQKWVKEVGAPKRLGNNAADEQYRVTLQRLGLSMLGANFMYYKDLKQKAEMLKLRREMRTVESVFTFWKQDLLQMRSLKIRRNKLAEKFILRKKMNIWQAEFSLASRLSVVAKRAQEMFEMNTKKKIFHVFSEISDKGRATNKLGTAFTRKNEAFIVKQMYKRWRALYQQKTCERRRERIEDLEIQGSAWRTWNLYVKQRREKARKQGLAERQWNEGLERLAKLAMKSWKLFIAQGKKRKEIEKLIQEKAKVKMYRGVLSFLAEQRIQGYKEKIGKLGEAQDEVKKKITETDERIEEVSKERSKLMQRAEEINDAVEGRKDEVQKKQKEIERLEEMTKDKKRKLDKLEEEGKKKAKAIQALESSNSKVTHQLENTVKTDEKTQENTREEKAQLNLAIQQINTDIQQQDRTAIEIEEEMAVLKEKKENYLKESKQAIEDLTKELKMTKESADFKYEELKRAVDLVQLLEKKNQELRAHLQGTHVKLEENSLDSRARIKTLEQQNEELIVETTKLKKESERRSRDIIELRGTAKRYEYAIQYMKNGHEAKLKNRLTSPLSEIIQKGTENKSPELEQEAGVAPFENGARSPDLDIDKEIGDLKSFLLERRRRLEKLDQKQDEILRKQEEPPKEEEPVIEEESFDPSPKVFESLDVSRAKGAQESKKKIDEIKRKLEGLSQGSSKILDESLRK